MSRIDELEKTVTNLKKLALATPSEQAAKPAPAPKAAPPAQDDDDDEDLFGSEDEGEAEARKARQAEVAASAKKAKPAAKSSIVLDVKPWDDTVDMSFVEKEVRKIEADGLLWGASQLVEVVAGIMKLQISCVVEDDKASLCSWLNALIIFSAILLPLRCSFL